MKLLSLSLTGFRNHAATAFEPRGAPLCLLRGPNAAGKTSVLEAIHLLATGIGLRTRLDRDFMRFNGEGYRIAAATDAPLSVALRCRRGGEREALVDDRLLSRWSRLIGMIRVTLLRPDDIDLLQGGPEYRRHFLNLMLCQSQPAYLAALRRFRRAWKQRQAAMGQSAVQRSFHSPLLTEMPVIFAARAAAVRRLEQLARDIYSHLRLAGKFSLEYRPAVPAGSDDLDWPAVAARCLEEGARLEATGSPHPYGPLRDEVSITLDEVALRRFGSQGQKRLAALVLRLAEAALLSEAGSRPLLIIDDVFGELDQERREAFLSSIKSSDCQVWIATTYTKPFEEYWKNWIRFDIHSGCLQGVETQ